MSPSAPFRPGSRGGRGSGSCWRTQGALENSDLKCMVQAKYRGASPPTLPRRTQPWPPSSLLLSLSLPPAVLLPVAAMAMAKFYNDESNPIPSYPNPTLHGSPLLLDQNPQLSQQLRGPRLSLHQHPLPILLTPALLMSPLPPQGLCTCRSFCLELTSCLDSWVSVQRDPPLTF